MQNPINLTLSHKPAVTDVQLQAYMNTKTIDAGAALLNSLGFGLCTDLDQIMIPDLTLAESLGFERPREIRRLITRHGNALMEHGCLFNFLENTGKRGRQFSGYLLTLEQAFYLIAKSETEIANALLFAMVEIVASFMRGELLPSDFKSALRLQERLQQEQLRIASHREEKEARNAAFKLLNSGRKRRWKPSVQAKVVSSSRR